METEKSRSGIEKKLFELCLPVVKDQGLLLYDMEWLPNTKLLRLYVMNPETKSAVIEDCVKVDHALGEPFEAHDWIPAEITLEVSSPGVYRHLTSLEHFQLAVGEMVSAVITGQIDMALNPQLVKKHAVAKKFRGKLLAADQEQLTLNVEEAKVILTMEQIKKANVDPDFEELMARAKE